MAPQPQATSWRTTIGGIIGALGVLFVGLGPLLDSDPNTHADLAGIIEAFGAVLAAAGIGYAGAKARDDVVTSEGRQAPKAVGALLVFMLPIVLLGCCSRPDLRPTVSLAREEFVLLESEAREGKIQLSPDKDSNERRLKARLDRFAAARAACDLALKEKP